MPFIFLPWYDRADLDRTGQVDKRKQRRRLRRLSRQALPGCAAGYLKAARYHRR